MQNQGVAAMIPTNRGAAPHPKNWRSTRERLLSGLGFSFSAGHLRACSRSRCSSAGLEKKQTAGSRPVSGFLGDYSSLAPDRKNGDLLLYEKDRSAMKKYNKFIVNPITIYLLPEARDRGIDADDLERLAKYFQDAVTDELTKSGRYQVVTTPGPDVLELNVAITNVEPTGKREERCGDGSRSRCLRCHGTRHRLGGSQAQCGEGEYRGKMLDSTSGERLVAFVTGKAGRRWFSGLSGFKKWADIEVAFRAWAKNFRERVDEVHGT